MELNQVTLPVNNIRKAVEFYLTFGFTQILDTPHYDRFMCPQVEATFSSLLTDTPCSNPTVFYFEHAELDVLYNRLTDKGIAFEQPPTERRYLCKEAILRDPSGNKIKRYFAGENRLNPLWRVTVKG